MVAVIKKSPKKKFTEALSLAARVPIEGEFIGKAPLQNNLPAICGRIILDYENGSVTRTEVVPLIILSGILRR
ncbi:hypothetical protein [Arsenophonus apicola]|uniref:hypothetical protein n=1 Tax=Arsenophonus apicola TaxID=2879119 RepID=UPI0035C038D0